MERYEGIDVPEFMKNRKKVVIIDKEQHEEQIENAYIKGAVMGVLTTFVLLGMMIFIAVIEMM